MKISSSCIYCGLGCRLIFEVKNQKIQNIFPDPNDPVSQGYPCIKGLTIKEIFRDRLLFPQIRVKGRLKKATWKEALQFIFENTKELAPQEIFLSGSGKITNEDNFIIQKFARVVLKTNNIDNCCSRLCHQPTVQAMNDCFGTPNLTYLDNLEKIDTLFIIGSNPASNYPAFWARVLKEKQKRKLKIILISSMLSFTTKNLEEKSDQVIIIEQGSEQVFLNGLLRFILTSGNFPQEIKTIEGFDRLKEISRRFTPPFVAQICQISQKEFLTAAKNIATTKILGIFHGMGITQHLNGIENIHSLLNLAILKQAHLLTLRGEINVQGAGDMKCIPLPLVQAPWQTPLPQQKGKNLIEAFYLTPVKAAFISGFNPAQSLPDLKRVWKNLEKMFLVIIDSYLNKTSEFAKVILPAPLLIERRGTITNGERRIRLVNQVLPPPGETKPEWQIYKALAKFWRQERHFDYQNEKQILEEIKETISDYSELNLQTISTSQGAWPKKKAKFKRFYPEDWEGYDNPRSQKYPFILTTYRQASAFLTSEATEKSPTLRKTTKRIGFYLHPQEAKKSNIKNGDKVEVESLVAKLRGKAIIDKNIPPKVIAASFHSKKFLINLLYPLEFDEETFTPNFKATAVRIKKI